MSKFATKIGSILGRLIGVLVRKGVLTEEEKDYIMEEAYDEELPTA